MSRERYVDIPLKPFLQAESTPQAKAIMQFGMFAGLNQSTEEDFRSAEFMGDSDNRLD